MIQTMIKSQTRVFMKTMEKDFGFYGNVMVMGIKRQNFLILLGDSVKKKLGVLRTKHQGNGGWITQWDHMLRTTPSFPLLTHKPCGSAHELCPFMRQLRSPWQMSAGISTNDFHPITLVSRLLSIPTCPFTNSNKYLYSLLWLCFLSLSKIFWQHMCTYIQTVSSTILIMITWLVFFP